MPGQASASIGEMAVQQHLRLDVRVEDGAAVVRLGGELDLASAPALEAAIERPEVSAAQSLVLDLGDLQFIDSTGLRTLFQAHARASQRRQDFAVTRGSEQVQRLLSITGTAEHLRIVDSPEDLARER
jgi:anti-anti-sigma factor